MRQDALGTVGDEVKEALSDRPILKRKRSKATYDLPPVIIEVVDEIAQAEEVARSDVVAWAIWELSKSYRAREVDWTDHREHATNNPRATWKLRIEMI